MAEVPYSPIPNATEHFEAAPEPHIATPGAAFGETIGRAISNLGTSTEQAGNELFQRAISMQQLKNEADARSAGTASIQQMGERYAQFQSQEGANASPEAYAKYIKDLDAIRVNNRSTLTNPHAQSLYDADSYNMMQRTMINGASHAATQLQQYDLGTIQSRSKAIDDQVLSNPTDVKGYQQGIKEKGQQAADYAVRKGFSKPQTDELVRTSTSSLTLNRIQGLAQQGLIPEANAALAQAEKDKTLAGEALNRAHDLIDRATLVHGPKQVVDQINQSMPGADPSEKAKAAEAAARKIAPNNPAFAAATRNASEADTEAQLRLKTIDDEQNWQIAIRGVVQPDGHVPATIEELKASSPDAAVAINKLDQQKLEKLQTILKDGQKWDNVDSPTRTANYERLRGSALEDPQAFMDATNDFSKIDLNNKQRKEVTDMRNTISNKGTLKDPETDQAMKNLGNYLYNTIGPQASNKDLYNSFRGALSEEINTYRLQGKIPTPDAIVEMAKRLMLNKGTEAGWFGYYHDVPTYRTEVPPEAKKQIIASPAWKGQQPTDEQILKIYRRHIFEQSQGTTNAQ